MTPPDYRIATDERKREMVSGLWHNGRFECDAITEYTTCCQSVWLTVSGFTTNGTEWTFDKAEVDQVEFLIAGEALSQNPYRKLKDGREFWTEEVIEAMGRCYEREMELKEESFLFNEG